MTRPSGGTFARSLGWNSAGTIAGQVAGLVLNIVLARSLGAEPLAAVLAGLTFAAIVGQAASMGFDRVGIVAVSQATPERRGAIAGGIVRVMLVGVVLAAVVSVVLPAVASSVFPWGPGGSGVGSWWLVVAVAAVAVTDAVRNAVGELPRGWLRTVPSVVVGASGRSVIALVVLVVLAAVGVLDTAERALTAFALGGLVLAGAAVALVRRLADGAVPDPRAAWRICRNGVVVMVGVVARGLIDQADVLVVAAAFDAPVAASYAIATRVANAVAGATIAINLTVLPLLGQSDEADRATLARAGSTIAAAIVIPACVVLAVFAEPLVRLAFGDELVTAVPFLRILLAGQVVNVVSGVAGAVLLDRGHHRRLLELNGGMSALILVAELAVLGLDDARAVAVANIVGFGLLNVSTWWSARRLEGVSCHAHLWPPTAVAAVRAALGRT